MDTTSLAEMLTEDQAAWDELVALLDAHPDQALHAGITRWTSRDVYAHLARWMEHSTSDLEARLAGLTRPPLAGTDDEINARWQEADSVLSFAETRERAHLAFQQRLDAIRSVPSARWSDPVMEAIARADGSQHYRAHRSYIAAD